MTCTYYSGMDVASQKFRYGEHARQDLTLHRAANDPCPPGPRPVVIAIHGGYWERQSSMQGWPRRLAAEAGYVVLEMRYRLNGDAPWPAQREDVHAVLDWVADHAADWGMDPERIALAGSSAGGHVAASAAVVPASSTARHKPSVRAVVGLSPPLSPYRAWKDGERPARAPWRRRRRYLSAAAARLADCPPSKDDADCWDTWQDMTVKHHAHPDQPPMWLGYFTNDLVPAIHGHDYWKAQTEAGAPPDSVAVLTMPGTGHAMTLLDNPAFAAAVHGFLSAHLRETPPLPQPREATAPLPTSISTTERINL